MSKHTDFTRLGGTAQPASRRRAEARAALFSEAAETIPTENRPTENGWLVLECSSCESRTRVGLCGILRAMVPSVHLPLLKAHHPSLMRCPRCRHHRWMSVSLAL